MSESDGRDRHTLTLLIQLFGREVLDCLARAGYDDEAAIAAAGPEHLATASGVSLPVARRIVAVVEEARGSSPGARAGADAAPPGAPREPRRRKGRSSRAAIKAPEIRIEAIPAPAAPDDVDAFVDDVALVTWMGFTSKTPAGRLSFSVADRILDPVHPEPDATEEAPTSAAIPAAPTWPATPAQKEPGAAGGADPDETPRRTLPGSFWSFGPPAGSRGTRDDETARPSARPTDTQAPGGAPRRRDRDDH